MSLQKSLKIGYFSKKNTIPNIQNFDIPLVDNLRRDPLRVPRSGHRLRHVRCCGPRVLPRPLPLRGHLLRGARVHVQRKGWRQWGEWRGWGGWTRVQRGTVVQSILYLSRLHILFFDEVILDACGDIPGSIGNITINFRLFRLWKTFRY